MPLTLIDMWVRASGIRQPVPDDEARLKIMGRSIATKVASGADKISDQHHVQLPHNADKQVLTPTTPCGIAFALYLRR